MCRKILWAMAAAVLVAWLSVNYVDPSGQAHGMRGCPNDNPTEPGPCPDGPPQ
jgi:hypothetical protein